MQFVKRKMELLMELLTPPPPPDPLSLNFLKGKELGDDSLLSQTWKWRKLENLAGEEVDVHFISCFYVLTFLYKNM